MRGDLLWRFMAALANRQSKRSRCVVEREIAVFAAGERHQEENCLEPAISHAMMPTNHAASVEQDRGSNTLESAEALGQSARDEEDPKPYCSGPFESVSSAARARRMECTVMGIARA